MAQIYWSYLSTPRPSIRCLQTFRRLPNASTRCRLSLISIVATSCNAFARMPSGVCKQHPSYVTT